MFEKKWYIRLSVDAPEGARVRDLEFPSRPTETELRLALAKFFSQMNFRFDEHLREVRECALLSTRSPIENSPD